MITIFTEKINSFSQKDYQKDYCKMIDELPFHKLSCACKQKGTLIRHGNYNRSIEASGNLIELSIIRVYCKSCKETHAILPSWIVPYSRILYRDHISIIYSYLNNLSFEPIMQSNLLIDEGNIRYIIRQYLSHWRERIASFCGAVDLSVTKFCFKHFSRQFMQIKSTANILFS